MASRTFNTVSAFNAAKATLAGDSGTDTLSFSSATAPVFLTDTDFAGMSVATVSSAAKWENLAGSTSLANQITVGLDAQIVGIVSLVGGSQSDIFNASAYSSAVTMSGGSGNDILIGGGGNDRIDGGSGTDTLLGGGGNDYYLVDTLSDVVEEYAASGIDSIQSSVTYTLSGNVEVITLSGSSSIHAFGNGLDNTLMGNSGANSLDGLDGSDSMVGGAGNDTYFVDNIGDIVFEALSTDGTADWVVSSINDYTLAGNTERLVLAGSAIKGTGNSLNNSLVGNSLDNSIAGGDGVDILLGNDGNDILDGGSGVDTLIGGSGDDTLDGGFGVDSLLGGLGDDFYLVDTLTDRIDESSIAGGSDTVIVSVNAYNMATYANNVETAVLSGTLVSITGNSIANSLLGNSAANSLSGAAGNDTLVGASGNDTLNGGTDADSMAGGLDNDYYFVDSLSDIVTEADGQGTDSVAASLNGYTLSDHVEILSLATGASFITATGNSLANTIIGNVSNNSLLGGDGNDSIDGGTGNDTLLGGAGIDTLNGGVGNDSLIGESGNDYYFVNSTADIILEFDGDGVDTASVSVSNYNMGSAANNVENAVLMGSFANLTGNSIANSLVGNSVANSLNGGAGNDTLVGDAGNDTLNGGTDSDSMAGGANDDYYFIDNSGDVILEASGAGTDTVSVSSVSSYILGLNLERLILVTDTTTGTGNSLANTLTGNSLANTLSGEEGADSLSGGTGDDSLTGGTGNDTINGEVGNDTLDGGTGNDRMLGGVGSDYYIIDISTDTVVELFNEGTDSILANINSVTLANSVEALILGNASSIISGTGNSEANTLVGNSNNNSLNGGVGADTLIGGTGNDYYTIDSTADVIIEIAAEGTDSVIANITGTTLSANVEFLILGGTVAAATGNSSDNTLIGNASANSLVGAAGNDSLYGGSGIVADTLVGGDGNDTLDGYQGIDRMDGGSGNDYYLVDSQSDIIYEADSSGTDSVLASTTGYTLAGNTEVLILSGTVGYGMGNSLSNTLFGNSVGNTLNGGEGTDSLIGGTGHDTYILNTITDKVFENEAEGTDLVVGYFLYSAYTLADQVENLLLQAGSYAIGNSLNNSLTGNSSANTLDGGTGADSLIGDTGADFYIVDQLGDMIFESGTDTDTVLAKYENHALGSSVENLILGTDIVAGAGNSLGNSLTGNSLANSLFGDVGNDTIVAQDGADTLNGGTGDDSMAGGLGDDFYLIDSLNDTIAESLSQGTDSVLANISGYTLAANVEYLELSGSFVAGTGNSTANTLVGNASGNTLDGGAGIDSMSGGTGNDTYFVDNTADQVGESSGAGTDTVVATVTAYTLADNVEALILSGTVATGTGNSISNTITGNASNNTLDGGEGIDTLIGGLGSDYYIIDNASDVLVENSSEGTDSVQSNISTYTLTANFEHLILGTGLTGIGNSLGNSLIGNADSNTLDGQTGSDTLAGGQGNDDYTIDDLTDKVIESTSAGDDRVTSNVDNYVLAANVEALLLGTSILNGTGNSLDNSIIGNALANSLSGAAGNDTFTAGAQNDTINGGAGDDSMAGGTGDDLYYADSLLDQIVEADSEGTDSVLASIESYVLAANIELLELSAGIVTGIGNSTVNTLLGNTIANSLAGDSGNDTLWGLAGNDTLDGGAGDDSLIGGSGDDFYIVDSTLDTILELSAGGTDTVFANLATYTINNQIENLVLGLGGVSGIGSSGANSILGNASGNSLDGGAGIDTLTGAGGNDTYFVSDSADLIIEEGDAGTDIVYSSVSGYTLSANVEGLVLTDSATIGYGSASDNTLTGNSLSANSLFGADGDDSLFGGSGSDTLDGGTGADSLIGGLGNDYFIVDNINDQVSDAGGSDSILVNVLGGFTLGSGSAVENLILGTGDQITGNVSNNSIWGNASTNTLDGGGGTDTLIGGNGNDYYLIDSIDDIIIEDLNGGTDTVFVSFSGYTLGANIENLALSDSAANASLIGGAGNNSLVGNSFDNTIDGGLGSDTMVGGTGNDYYVVDNLGDRIVEVSGAGTDSVVSNVISFTLSSDIEVLILGNYAVTGVGSSLNNTLIGNSKANSLNGGDGADSLFSGGGNDTLNGGAGIDIMVGSSGNDYFVVDNASDSIVSGGGTDGIIVQYNNYTLAGGGWNILVLDGATALQGYGSSGNDTITGSIYNNTLNGNGGDDRLLGLTGHDYYIVDSIGDVVIEAASEGTDSVESRLSTYTLGVNVERLILGSGALDGIGNSLANILVGNTDNNSLTGAAGMDSLSGGNGSDTLLGALATSSGGRGEIDTLTGGSGNDVFVLGSASGCLYDDGISTSLGTSDYVYITDFVVGTDKLQLLGSDANYRLGSHTVTGLTDYQGLFRELGTTDELVAILQNSPLTTLDNTTVNWV
jgi:Ca2+-binding RTX toxin-like protein